MTRTLGDTLYSYDIFPENVELASGEVIEAGDVVTFDASGNAIAAGDGDSRGLAMALEDVDATAGDTVIEVLRKGIAYVNKADATAMKRGDMVVPASGSAVDVVDTETASDYFGEVKEDAASDDAGAVIIIE